jgi:hypothetical protein
VHYMVGRSAIVLLLITAACFGHRSERATGGGLLPHRTVEGAAATRAGIAIVGTGGLAGWEQITIIDSASARFMTVTRGPCGASCAPFDSAAGTLPVDAIQHIYDVVREEKVFSLPEDYGTCPMCADLPVVTTAVFANNQRKVITSNSEATPEILGRVHMAVAEAIRSAREAR